MRFTRWFHRFLVRWQKRFQVARTVTRDVLTNLRLGNQVEKVTDFRACKRPILLLYGFASTRRALRIVELRLRRRTDRCVFSINLGGYKETLNTAGIVGLAKLVDEKVEAISRRYGVEEIDIVAHSKGGLIARYYIKRLNGARRVRHLVTLATPHRGTWASFFAIPLLGWMARSVWQMTPFSPFIRQLHKGAWPSSVNLVSISSTADWIAPPSRCNLDLLPGEPTRNVQVAHVSHGAMLYSKEIFEHIVTALTTANAPLTPMSDPAQAKADPAERPLSPKVFTPAA
jgi:pimeloyl-ACP methyl ester carboxylesterase